LPASFSNVTYRAIAPYAWLDPTNEGSDILSLEIFRSRLPIDIFRKTYEDVTNAALQYGRMEDHDNEEARSRYIASVSCSMYQVYQTFELNIKYLVFFPNSMFIWERGYKQTRGLSRF
jgi:hypothetical protein